MVIFFSVLKLDDVFKKLQFPTRGSSHFIGQITLSCSLAFTVEMILNHYFSLLRVVSAFSCLVTASSSIPRIRHNLCSEAYKPS